MKHVFVFSILTLVSACALPLSDTQTTSGAAFLADNRGAVDADIASAAAQEPDLQFPARIGIARITDRHIFAQASKTGRAASTQPDCRPHNSTLTTSSSTKSPKTAAGSAQPAGSMSPSSMCAMATFMGALQLKTAQPGYGNSVSATAIGSHQMKPRQNSSKQRSQSLLIC